MSMLGLHAEALESHLPCLHEFKSRYSKSAAVVYGFVEGKDDPSFYRGFIDSVLPTDWTVELWPAGSKGNVYKIQDALDWGVFPKKRICFFVDRDLSDLVGETLKDDENIYVTPSYSIENEAATRTVCFRILKEMLGFSNALHDEMDSVCDQFETQLERFYQQLSETMAWILHWRRNQKPASLSNIEMKHLFSFSRGVLQTNATPKNAASTTEYVHTQCGVPLPSHADANATELSEFNLDDNYRRFSRGKFVLWFVVEFCRSVHSNATTFFPTINKKPKASVQLSFKNGITQVAPRCRMPPCLQDFLNETFMKYVATRRR